MLFEAYYEHHWWISAWDHAWSPDSDEADRAWHVIAYLRKLQAERKCRADGVLGRGQRLAV